MKKVLNSKFEFETEIVAHSMGFRLCKVTFWGGGGE